MREVTLTRRRDRHGDFEYVTEDGYKAARVDGSRPWMVTGPGILTVRYVRNLEGVRQTVRAAREGDYSWLRRSGR